jgi:hypothetical protein
MGPHPHTRWDPTLAPVRSGGFKKATDLLYLLRRNETLLRQRREALEARNAELRATLVARGLQVT